MIIAITNHLTKQNDEHNVHGCIIWKKCASHKAMQHTDLHLSAHFVLSELINLRDSAQKNRMPCLTTCSLPPFTLAQFQLTTLVCLKKEKEKKRKERKKTHFVTTYDQKLLLVLFLLWCLYDNEWIMKKHSSNRHEMIPGIPM